MSTTLDNEELVKLATAGGAGRRNRINRALLAQLLREKSEGSEEEGDEEGGEGEERNIARLLIGSRMLRRKRIRNLLLAHLLRQGSEEEPEGEDEEGGEEATGEDEGNFVRMLIGSRLLRRKRIRKVLLAKLLRDKASTSWEGAEDEGSDEAEEEGGEDNQVVRALIGSRFLRRKRARRILLAHLLRSRSEASEGEDEDFEGDDESGENGGGDDRRFARMLMGSRFLRRKRARRMLLAHLLRGQTES